MVAALRLASGFLHCALMAYANETPRDGRLEERRNEATATTASPSVCDARTINHITHTLPQLCLTKAWTSAAPSYNETAASVTPAPDESPHWLTSNNMEPKATASAPAMNGSAAYQSTAQSESEAKTEPEMGTVPEAELGAEADVESDTETEGVPFMSFEDWKEMMLRQTGQDPQELRSRRAAASQDERRIPPEIGDFGLGEEDEISLDFENYLIQAGRESHEAAKDAKDSVEGSYGDDAGDALLYERDKTSLHRSKDAGKTCKERFSYSSFDAGATILKTGRSTKNAKAILIENKDSYMLLECGADSKYVIVELSDDILIDTVVLANFEFFSSMIRQFRVSVSDRYPVKMDRWKEIGSFEARNSRDIQAFLVENPQIWAKYVRIEFHTHYGNEYYCPVSLLRIHGSRMLDSWKDMDGGREEEMSMDEDEFDTVEAPVDAPVPSMEVGADDEARGLTPQVNFDYTPWPVSPLAVERDVCLEMTAAEEGLVPKMNEEGGPSHDRSSMRQNSDSDGDTSVLSEARAQSMLRSPDQTSSSAISTTVIQETASSEVSSAKTTEPWATSSTINNTTPSAEHLSPPTKASSPSSPGQRPRGSGTMGAPGASPTVQEGFFNAITKRLHHAEANLTLTMQYLEDHSRYVQESLQKAEQKQLFKVTAFLDNLNQTVLAELRGLRDQYDQIWQSTVIALETQREQADHDIVALSSRLNLLADEVVFQKRMAIVQAVLLLCCLFLVIFSRGVPIPYLAPLLDQAGASMPGASPSHHAGDSLSNRTLYTSRSRQDDADNHQFDSWSSSPQLTRTVPGTLHTALPSVEGPGEDIGSLISCESDLRGPSAAPRFTRLSPPLTPSFEASSPAATELPSSDCGPDGPLPRRLTAYHAHANQSRKPLPALPEYPSPERPSSL